MSNYIELEEGEMKPEEKNEPVSVTRSEAGGIEATSGDHVSYVWPDHAGAFRAYFQAERDKELGRERDHEHPEIVVRAHDTAPDGTVIEVEVYDEENGYQQYLERGDDRPGLLYGRAARRWFAAHPPKRELPTNLGAIVEAGTYRALLARPEHPYPWVAFFSDGFSGYYSGADLLAAIGPDWTLVHEGMVADDE